MRMMWLFIILGISAALVFLASTAMYMRVRRHLRESQSAPEPPDETPKRQARES
jgi:hypothetical protein